MSEKSSLRHKLVAGYVSALVYLRAKREASYGICNSHAVVTSNIKELIF